MNAKPFFDTNILIYGFSEGAKAEAAAAAMEKGGVISVQILNEFVNVCQRKLKLDWLEIEQRLGYVRGVFSQIMPLTTHMHDKACVLAKQHGFPIYDSMVIACALQSGCEKLITEDMQHGREIEGLTILNPFAH